MALLVMVHVLSAVIGIGPTYFFPVLLRPAPSPSELRGLLQTSQRLARYPQIGGPIAVLSGIAIVCLIDTHLFAQKWIAGSILLFVLIQIVVVAFGVPASKKVGAWAFAPANVDATAMPPGVDASYQRARNAHKVAAVLGTALFALMILKPG